MKQTCLDRYGNENYNNLDQFKKTCLEKYGVENFVHTEKYKELVKKDNLKKCKIEVVLPSSKICVDNKVSMDSVLETTKKEQKEIYD
jgi:hypothetical protein